MSNTQNAERVSPLEQLVRLAERSGLLDCIDDAYLERGDWQPLVAAFAEAVQSAERERCAKLCDSTAGNHRGQPPSRAGG